MRHKWPWSGYGPRHDPRSCAWRPSSREKSWLTSSGGDSVRRVGRTEIDFSTGYRYLGRVTETTAHHRCILNANHGSQSPDGDAVRLTFSKSQGGSIGAPGPGRAGWAGLGELAR